MISARAFASGVLVLLLSTAASRQARAYCRTGTCPLPANYAPKAGACEPADHTSCVVDGKQVKNVPLWWRSPCTSYDLQLGASKSVSLADATAVAEAVFQTWTSSANPSPGGMPLSMTATDLGPVACGEVGYHSDRKNQHVIVFRDSDWPNSRGELALTTMSFEVTTGEIFDADIEINTADFKFTTHGEGGVDLAHVLTHEVGHFFGLAHSPDAPSVMARAGTPGAALFPDDVAGIYFLYPPTGKRPVDTSVDPSGAIQASACDAKPRHGFSTECDAGADDVQPGANKSSCQCGLAAPRPTRGIFCLTALCVASLVARRSRRGAPQRGGLTR